MFEVPRIRVDWRASFDLTGTVLLYLAVPLGFPLLAAGYYGEPLYPFLATIAIALLLGGGLSRLGDPELDLGPREAFLAVAMIWFLVAAVGAVPFVIAGNGTTASPVNALFEAMSGLTTTGATVFQDFSVHSQSILLWRQLIQWLGGLGILILATAVLSSLGVGGAQLMESETQTRDLNKLTPKISETARLIWGLYVGVTGLAIGIFYALGLTGLAPNMTLFNATAHAFTSVATAGFSPEPGSAGAFTPIAQWAIIPFMILGSTNFILLYLFIHGEPMRLLKNQEFHFFLGSLGLFSAVVATILVIDSGITLASEATIRHALFNVTSIITTTGYASADFAVWSPGAQYMLFLGMFLGGMVGSTTCSIKSLRWLVALKSLRRSLYTSIHPDAIRPVRISGGPVDEDTISDIYAYLLLSLCIFATLAIFVVVDASRVSGLELSAFEAMGAAAATFLNIGPAFGPLGPFGTYDILPTSSKLVMIVLMWIGRIEIIPVLVLFTKAFWTS